MTNIFNRFENEVACGEIFDSQGNELDIEQFLKQELLEMMTKTIGKEETAWTSKPANESLTRFLDGYNLKRDNLIQIYRELYGDELVDKALEKLNK